MENELKPFLRCTWGNYPMIDTLYYLHIEGQYGNSPKFIGGYFNMDELEERGQIKLNVWCKEHNLTYVESDTFDGLIQLLKNYKNENTLY